MRFFAVLLLWLAGSASAGSVRGLSSPCIGSAIGHSYDDVYSNLGDPVEIDLRFYGQTMFVVVRMTSGIWMAGEKLIVSRRRETVVDLWSPSGDTGSLRICSTGTMSSPTFQGTVNYNGGTFSGPQDYFSRFPSVPPS